MGGGACGRWENRGGLTDDQEKASENLVSDKLLDLYIGIII